MIIITGASRGIGEFLMRRFIAENEKVTGIYNLTKPNHDIHVYYKADIRNPDEVGAVIDSQKEHLEQLVLINCAGSNYNVFAHKADPKKWADLISVNLIGTFNMINALLPFMRDQGYGRIINLSSIVAQTGIPGTSAYAASKSGMWGLTRAVAVENASKGITVNNLNLGYFDIGMADELPASLKEKTLERIPLKKFGPPEEIFNAVKYLIDSEYITGTSIDINGGLF